MSLRQKTQEERKGIFGNLLSNVRMGDLEEEQKEKVKEMLRNCSSLFVTSDNDPIGLIKGLEVGVLVEGHPNGWFAPFLPKVCV